MMKSDPNIQIIKRWLLGVDPQSIRGGVWLKNVTFEDNHFEQVYYYWGACRTKTPSSPSRTYRHPFQKTSKALL